MKSENLNALAQDLLTLGSIRPALVVWLASTSINKQQPFHNYYTIKIYIMDAS